MEWAAANPLLGLGFGLAALIAIMVLGPMLSGLERHGRGRSSEPSPRWEDDASQRQAAAEALGAIVRSVPRRLRPDQVPLLTDTLEMPLAADDPQADLFPDTLPMVPESYSRESDNGHLAR